MAAQTSNSKTLDGKHAEDMDNMQVNTLEDANGVQIVGTQAVAIADASGGSTVDAEARTALNDLLAKLRTHGLIAT